MVGFLNFQLSSAYRVKIGRQFYNRTRKAKPLILINFIEAVTRKRVRLDSSYEEADLLLLSGADLRDAVDERKGLVSGGDEPTLERVAFEMSGGGKVLIVSFENHQHPYWEDFGDQLMRSNLPRLTFYPSEIDSRGERFPYWWNYLDWPDFPRPRANYKRYGRLYDLDKLMQPVPVVTDRRERACWVGTYEQEEPRKSLLARAEQQFGLDVYGGAGIPFQGPKHEILRQYKYSVAAENSYGCGYDSEKVPEVWDSGCVPLAGFAQPYSDFNSNVLDPRNPTACHSEPLLLSRPNPSRLLDYLDGLVG